MHPTFAALEYEVVSATDGMQEADFATHPEGKWCVAEILEHLTMAFRGTVKGCKRCLDTGQPIATKSSLIKRAKALWVIDLGMFPEGVASPKGVVPKGAVQGKSALDGILQVIGDMDMNLQACEEKFGAGNLLMDHPIFGALDINHWRKFHLIHTHHHMKQVRELRAP